MGKVGVIVGLVAILVIAYLFIPGNPEIKTVSGEPSDIETYITGLMTAPNENEFLIK